MKQRTTTRQITEAVTSDLLTLTKVERHYKLSSQIKKINVEEFTEYIQFLNESGVFVDFIGWHYEMDSKADGEIVFESGRLNPYTDYTIVTHMCVNDGVNVEDVERILKIEEK